MVAATEVAYTFEGIVNNKLYTRPLCVYSNNNSIIILIIQMMKLVHDHTVLELGLKPELT